VQRELKRRAAVLPPATLGVVGGGELGRFFALAAQRRGYRVAVLDPDPDGPAMQVADERIVAPYNDSASLERLGALCDAVTIGFEGVRAGSVAHLEKSCIAVPRAESVALLQDRIGEKRFLRGIGLPVAPFVPVIAAADLATAGCYPGILKLARQGYDGKGQARVTNAQQAARAWRELGGRPCVLERCVAVEMELSVVLARGAGGDARAFPVAENHHRGGILELTVAPARASPQLAARAVQTALRIAECLDYSGVLSVEFFLSDGALLVNGIAPRPHNSGHFTMEACAASQFEQQVRALCDLELADPAPRSAAAMLNVLGDAWDAGEPDWGRVLGACGGNLHLYGKAQARPRRKMGHITILREHPADAAMEAERCLERLSPEPRRASPQAERRAA
jgi:5-(carboxyamino)imidazole ribonucleotide synthase